MFNSRKFNKTNISIIIVCFMLVILFIFGCVQFTFAASRKNIAELLSDYSGNSSNFLGVEYSNQYSSIYCLQSFSGRVCAVVETKGNSLNFGFVSDNPFTFEQYNQDGYTYPYSYDRKDSDGFYKFYASTNTLNDYKSSILTFGSFSDAYNYIQTGEINDPIYDNRPIEFDDSIEIPLMAQCQVNGDEFLFNCKQSEPHNDYKLQISASVSLTPVYSNLTSKQYADIQQIYTSSKSEIGKYDNSNTTFNVSFSSTDLLNGLDTSRSSLGFKEFYNGYNILLPYKESVLSKIYFYARNVSGVKCSNWVKVTYDLITETSVYEEVESVSGSDVPSDTKKDSSEYYPNDYIYNDDEPVQDSNSGGIIGYIKSGLGLVGNNSIIALIGNTFSFLPRELTTLLLFGGALLVAVGVIKVVTR